MEAEKRQLEAAAGNQLLQAISGAVSEPPTGVESW